MTEFTRYCEKIRWQEFFSMSTDPTTFDPALKLYKPNIAPAPQIQSSPIHFYLLYARHQLDTHFSTYAPPRESCTKPLMATPMSNDSLRRTIEGLRKNRNITIKIADKSNAIVILDTKDYHAHALSHLNDKDTYMPLTQEPNWTTIWRQLIGLCLKHRICKIALTKVLPSDEKYKKIVQKLFEHAPPDLLADTTTHTHTHKTNAAKFYVVMKMHKNPIASRPIASSINTITHNCSVILDTILQPYLRKVKTFTESSTEVVRKLQNIKLPNNCVLMCADVEALYPSIPTTPALKAIKEYLQYLGMPAQELSLTLDLLNWVLTNNYIQFGSLYFLQTRGTAMGTPAAVVFAVLFLAHLEERLVLTQILDPQAHPLISFRYIDDLFLIFRHKEAAENYRNLFNAQYPTIKTTGTIDDKSGIFLDLEIYKSGDFQNTGYLATRLYQKSTNKYLYISPASYHPRHVLTNFIRAELQRYRKLDSDDKDYYKHKQTFKRRLQERYYPDEFLTPLFLEHHDRAVLLEQKGKKDHTRRPTFITALGPDLEHTQLSKLLDPRQQLSGTKHLAEIFNNRPPLIVPRYPDSIGKSLIRATTKYP